LLFSCNAFSILSKLFFSKVEPFKSQHTLFSSVKELEKFNNFVPEMQQQFNLKEFFRKNRKQILFSISLFWFIFALLAFIEDEIAVRIANMKVDPVDTLQYSIRWILWTLLTPLIIFLAVKFPIRKNYLVPDIAKHFILALFVIALEFAIEIPIIRFATLQITGILQPLANYAEIFILKLNIYFLLYFLIVGTTYLILFIESDSRSRSLAQQAELKNQQLQTQLSEAKLSFLKMQLDPHFLFNTHHSIISLMLDNQNEKAITMLTKLSDLLRLSLEDEQQTIFLEKEIQLLKLYLDIQQIRFHERLKISFNIEPKSLRQKVPSFILQPLVENAIKHGISVSSHARNISIESHIENNKLILKVENDGSTIDFKNFHEGIGIANTKERLHQLYNSQSTFELKNTSTVGVTAIITIPTN
jgi:two-component system, LytTR family, sensor kinase